MWKFDCVSTLVLIRDEVESLIHTLLISSEDTCDWFTQLALFSSNQFFIVVVKITNNTQCNTKCSQHKISPADKEQSQKRKAEVFSSSDRFFGFGVEQSFVFYFWPFQLFSRQHNSIFHWLATPFFSVTFFPCLFVYPFDRLSGWLCG